MFKYLGRLAAAHPVPICLAWLAAAVVVGLAAPAWDNRACDDDIHFLPPRCDSVKGHQLLEEAFPQDVHASRLLFAVERRDGPLTPADLELVDDMAADLRRLADADPALQIARICSHRDPIVGKRLLSADGCCTLLQVSLGTPYLALQTRATADAADACVRRRLHTAEAAGQSVPAVYTTGAAGIGRDLITASADSLESTTLATVVLVVVLLLLVYRAPLLALVPLATIAVSVWVALEVLALCTLIPGFCLVNVSKVFAVVMLYGAGTDYCLFLISRYREELGRGFGPGEALARGVGGVGGALAASAGTVICGLGLMGLAEFAKVRCGGPAIAVSLAVALLASLTLAPALLRLLGPVAFWPHRVARGAWSVEREASRLRLHDPRSTRHAPRATLWDRLSRHVVARPLWIWATAVLVLLPLAVVGFGVRPNYRATGELAPTADSVRGLAAVERHFTPGEVGPITVLLESSDDWEGPEGQALLAHLSQVLARLDNVAEVRSLTQPLGSPLSALGDRLSALGPGSPAGAGRFQAVWRNVVQGMADQINRTAADFYVARLPAGEAGTRHVTRLDVVPRTDPFDPASLATLELVQLCVREEVPRYLAPAGVGPASRAGLGRAVRAECFGITVNARDLAAVTESDRLRINTLVLAGIFLILLALVRRPGMALYLLGTVLFSYYASLGATTLLAHCWDGRPAGEVDWRVPFFLFTILVAVGEDYNILLMTRAVEERKRYGAVEGMRRALARTGGTITSCGLIMAGTFATLMLGGLSTLVQIGFALAFGVLLDTFVVRPFLVPAFALWAWRHERPQRRGPTPGPRLAPETRRAA
jgi:RND superfamily putative drug exporter